MKPTIDIGEATVGSIGILDILECKPDLSKATRNEVLRMPKEIEELARQFIAGDKIKDKLTLFDQKKVAKALTANPEPAMMAVLDCDWIEPAAVIGQSLRIRGILSQALPVLQLKKLFSTEQLPVASFTWHDFEHTLRLLDKPLTIFGCMQSGRITRKLVNAFSQAYPSLFEAIAGEICKRAVVAIAAGHSISTRVEDSLSVLLSVDGIGAKVAAAIGTPKQPGGAKGGQPTNVKHGAGLSLAPKSAALDGQS